MLKLICKLLVTFCLSTNAFAFTGNDLLVGFDSNDMAKRSYAIGVVVGYHAALRTHGFADMCINFPQV